MMKKWILIHLFMVSFLTGCDENDDSKESNDSTVVEQVENDECSDLENCSKSIFGIPAYFWPSVLEENFSEGLVLSEENENLNIFRCGVKVTDLYMDNFGDEPSSIENGVEKLFNFSEKILDLNTCRLKAGYKKTLIDIINKGN